MHSQRQPRFLVSVAHVQPKGHQHIGLEYIACFSGELFERRMSVMRNESLAEQLRDRIFKQQSCCM